MDNMFNLKLDQIFEQIGDHAKIVLATSNSNNRVSARNMCFIILNKKLYFQTDNTFRKYYDLKENNQVALCINNIQIEGICEELGHPLDNVDFINKFKEYFISSFKAYSSLESERLFVINPTFIQKWSYIDDKPVIEQFNINQLTYVKKYYSKDKIN